MTSNENTFSVIEEGSYCQIRETGSYTIQCKADWETFWKKHTGNPKSKPPKVDFRWNTVVAICLGEKRSGGYSIEVKGVEDTGEDLLIFTEKTTPQGGSATMAFSQPFCIIKLKKVKNRVIKIGGLK